MVAAKVAHAVSYDIRFAYCPVDSGGGEKRSSSISEMLAGDERAGWRA